MIKSILNYLKFRFFEFRCPKCYTRLKNSELKATKIHGNMEYYEVYKCPNTACNKEWIIF